MTDLVLDGQPIVIVAPTLPPPVNLVILPGPVGPTGPAGRDLVEVFNGDGPPPDLIVGARVGDYYIDDLTGTFYQLGSGD